DALGEAVDRDLLAQDVRLTTGGEPTFVATDDAQSAEWNTAALGPPKRLRADELVRRLRARFAPGGLLHDGLGRWSGGEPQPRWGLSLYGGRDGVPLWRNPDLLAPAAAGGAASLAQAEALARAIAARLGLAAERVLPAFEDPVPLLRREADYPVDVDPLDPKLADREGR